MKSHERVPLRYRGLQSNQICTWETHESTNLRLEVEWSIEERVETHSKAKRAASLPIRCPPLSIYQYRISKTSNAETPVDQ